MQAVIDATPFVSSTPKWREFSFAKERISNRAPRRDIVEITTDPLEPVVDFFFSESNRQSNSSTQAYDQATGGSVESTTLLTNSFASTIASTSEKRGESSDTQRIASQRVQLLAAKYVVGQEVPEIVARLEILNRRLLKAAPLVSIEQVQALEDANEQIARVQASRAQRAKRLGLTL